MSLAGFAASFSVSAEESTGPKVLYYDLDPNIITNYQKPPARRLGFVTIDVQFEVNSEEKLDLLEHHKALLEDTLIDIINQQEETLIKDTARRGELRDLIKSRVSEVLKEETGNEVIQSVLITKFIFQ